MTRIERFTNRIALFTGVESFVLVRRDGELITHNMTNPAEYASMTSACGVGLNDIRQAMGFSTFDYMVFNRPDERNFFIFSLEKYFLGIQQVTGADSSRLVAEVRQFLRNLVQQRQKEMETTRSQS